MIKNVFLSKGDLCNFCFTNYDYKPAEGITWQREEDGKWYHVCNDCTNIFGRRLDGKKNMKIREKGDISESEKIEDANKQQNSRGVLTAVIDNGVMWNRDAHIEKVLIKEFTEDEEEFLGRYSKIIKNIKNERKKAKAIHTYIKNRLKDEWFIDKMIQDGYVNSQYYDFIRLEDIDNFGKWDAEEIQIIEDIKQQREAELQFRKDHPEEYRKRVEKEKEEAVKKWEEKNKEKIRQFLESRKRANKASAKDMGDNAFVDGE